ncbi:MAG: hypothetical protein JW797_14800 [Bradymonadales bacterium]|nr:hypothetical protein [Bradymonadales bacterium]
MDKLTLACFALATYVLITAYLAYRGWRRTKTLESFAIGNRTIHPAIVGLSLAAQLTSVATFVVNPGLVFSYGLAGLMGYGVAAAIGITAGLVIFSSAFRRFGTTVTALTVPQWIGARFRSRGLSLAFAVLSMALLSFAVLIVVAISHVLHALLGIPAWTLALALILFVYGYVLLGGVNTHAYTNAVQAVVMLVVAVILLASGLPSLWEGEGLFARLAASDPMLVRVVNPHSLYFRNLFEVFGANLLVGLALVCQPHVLSKSLYLKQDRDLRQYLLVAIATGTVFVMVMWVGLFARLELPANTAMDLVVPTYIASHFSSGLQVLISIGILCAGISTLEGILLALSTIISTDLYLGILGDHRLKSWTGERKSRSALAVGRGSIVLLGVATFFLARWQIANPTGGSVAIFAQYGVYLIITTSLIPLASGMFLRNASRSAVVAGTIAAGVGYLVTALFKISFMANNPAFLASVGILTGSLVFGLTTLARRALVPRPAGRSSHSSNGMVAT